MKLKVGDWVSLGGVVAKIAELSQSDDYAELVGRKYVGPAHLSDLEPLTVAEVFAYAGFPLSEGARLHFKTDARSWHFVSRDGGFFGWHAFVWALDSELPEGGFHTWGDGAGWSSEPSTLPDLSPLPVANCFECLPEVVKKALTEEGS